MMVDKSILGKGLALAAPLSLLALSSASEDALLIAALLAALQQTYGSRGFTVFRRR